MDIVRVLRIVEYVGPRDWVEHTVKNAIHGEKSCGIGKTIRATTLGVYPDLICERQVPKAQG